MPAVSIIIPIYNVELYIDKCSRSIFEQTLKDIEIIFIDDCSPDNSVRVIEKTLAEYPMMRDKVQIVKMPQNSGVAMARRHGISIAQGEYVAFCDSDDWLDCDMYRLLYSEAIEKKSDCVLCDYYETDGQNLKEIKYTYESKTKLMSDILSYKKGGSMCFYIAKRELFNNIVFPIKHMWEDLVVSIQIYNAASNIVQFNGKPLYFYYQNPKSVSYKPSIEASLSRMNNSGENIKLIESILAEKQLLTSFSDEILLLKYYSLFFVAEYTNRRKIRILWRNTYPGIVSEIIRKKKFSKSLRVKTILLNFGLFPFIKKVGQIFNRTEH